MGGEAECCRDTPAAISDHSNPTLRSRGSTHRGTELNESVAENSPRQIQLRKKSHHLNCVLIFLLYLNPCLISSHHKKIPLPKKNLNPKSALFETSQVWLQKSKQRNKTRHSAACTTRSSKVVIWQRSSCFLFSPKSVRFLS